MRFAKDKLPGRAATLTRIAALAATVICYGGCVNPKELPGFRGAVSQQEAKATRETEEAVKESASLRELDRLCRDEVPVPAGFVPVYRSHDQKQKRFLSNYYSSDAEYKGVRDFYKDQLTGRGWRQTGERERGWGSDKLEFQKDGYRVTIFHGGMGKGVDYSINCMRLSESD